VTKIQKKWVEVPLLLAFFWLAQAMEISLTVLPWNLGSFSVFFSLLAYVSFSRGWEKTTVLAYLIAIIASSTAGTKGTLFIVSLVWAALFSKVLTSAFNLEGRNSFAILTGWFVLFQKMAIWGLLIHFKEAPTIGLFFVHTVSQIVVNAAIAWLVYPAYIKWDQYFEHVPEEEKNTGLA
jgi:hypothetical protein